MRILFVQEATMHRWPGDTMEAPHYYCSRGSLEALGHEYYVINYDCIPYLGGAGLFDAVKELKPDLICATALLALGDGNVDPGIYAAIRDNCCPVVILWLESAPHVVQWADYYAPCVTANVFVDTAEYWRQFTKFPDKTHWVPEPKDPRIFYADASVERDIQLSFIGSTKGRLDRALNIAWLTGHGIEVVTSGGINNGQPSTITDYANLLRRSQITLNFTSATTFQHINGRTSEATMCGALLMESDSPETARLLEPFRHYMPFTEQFHVVNHGHLANQQGDLIERLSYFMGRGAVEGREIAERGQRRAMELFDGRLFWQRIFEIAGLA
jgi:hypothetical protein